MEELHRPRLSYHAYEQFCKRFYKASKSTVEAHVMPGQVKTWLSWGCTRIHNYRGVDMVCREGTIVTVFPPEKRKKKKCVKIEESD